MRPKILSEKNIVVVLFVMVLITFALAQEDTKKMERAYTGMNSTLVSTLILQQNAEQSPHPDVKEPAAKNLPE